MNLRRRLLFFLSACFLPMGARATSGDDGPWADHLLERREGEVRVHILCDSQAGAEAKAESFIIAENAEGQVYISYQKPVMPPMPERLSETARLRKDFRFLSEAERQSLDDEGRAAYQRLEGRMKIFDRFMAYISSLGCYEHSSAGARFSRARNLVWKSEAFIDSNLRPKGWKIDVYEAEVAVSSRVERRFVFVGPCRARTELGPSCPF